MKLNPKTLAKMRRGAKKYGLTPDDYIKQLVAFRMDLQQTTGDKKRELIELNFWTGLQARRN